MPSLHTLLPQLYHSTRDLTDGNVADYIPQLANINPDLYAISFCDIYGKQTHVGDTTQDFCLQSCSKPFAYCLARTRFADGCGDAVNVHKHVGFEPSGRAFNEFVLNHDGLPHNPLINAGAIMVASLVLPSHEPSDRFNAVMEFYGKLSGHAGRIGFDNAVCLSEKHHADRNLSLAYYMRENHAYSGEPTPSQLQDHLNLYFQCCSVTVNAQVAAVMAATLANQGVCPLNGSTVVPPYVVKDVLAIMYSCGMYDYSGQFGFEVGLPAKSGVSGCVLVAIPNVGGLCIWSPRLDRMGNSVRALACCAELTRLTGGRYHLFGRGQRRGSKGTRRHERSAKDPAGECVSENEAEGSEGSEGSEGRAGGESEDSEEREDACAERTAPPLSNRAFTSMLESDRVEEEEKGHAEPPAAQTTYHIIAAASEGNVAYLERVADSALLKGADYDGRTALHLACAEGHPAVVRLLMSLGVPKDIKDRWGNTPLHEVCKYEKLHPTVRGKAIVKAMRDGLSGGGEDRGARGT